MQKTEGNCFLSESALLRNSDCSFVSFSGLEGRTGGPEDRQETKGGGSVPLNRKNRVRKAVTHAALEFFKQKEKSE